MAESLRERLGTGPNFRARVTIIGAPLFTLLVGATWVVERVRGQGAAR
ncbi:hypothetical protein [Streptomyces sp. Ru71]|nr:hypothetical protein [Streptomyces sp. Ru71]